MKLIKYFMYYFLICSIAYSCSCNKKVDKCKKNQEITFDFYFNDKLYGEYDLYYLPSCYCNNKRFITTSLQFSKKKQKELANIDDEDRFSVTFINGTKKFSNVGFDNDFNVRDYDYIDSKLINSSLIFFINA